MTGLTLSSAMILACSSRIPRRYRRHVSRARHRPDAADRSATARDGPPLASRQARIGGAGAWGCEVDVSIGTLVLVPVDRRRGAAARAMLRRGSSRSRSSCSRSCSACCSGRPCSAGSCPTTSSTFLSEFGLAMLFFLAGNEIDFAAIRGRPLTRARRSAGSSPSRRRSASPSLFAADAAAAAFIGNRADLDRARHDHAGAARLGRPAHPVRRRR